MQVKLRDLEETKSFYQVELKKEELTETQREKYLSASKVIEGIIREKELAGEVKRERKKPINLVLLDK